MRVPARSGASATVGVRRIRRRDDKKSSAGKEFVEPTRPTEEPIVKFERFSTRRFTVALPKKRSERVEAFERFDAKSGVGEATFNFAFRIRFRTASGERKDDATVRF